MTFLDLVAYKKLTLAELSRRSGIPNSTLSDIANGKTDILDCSGKTLLGISKVLGVSIEELLNLEPEEAKSLLPHCLLQCIKDYRKAVKTNSHLIDCHSDQLNSEINVSEVEGIISSEQADRLRRRYFY